ncbi:hypothetical protein QBC39DRAFT_361319, partial [Podospora conica]
MASVSEDEFDQDTGDQSNDLEFARQELHNAANACAFGAFVLGKHPNLRSQQLLDQAELAKQAEEAERAQDAKDREREAQQQREMDAAAALETTWEELCNARRSTLQEVYYTPPPPVKAYQTSWHGPRWMFIYSFRDERMHAGKVILNTSSQFNFLTKDMLDKYGYGLNMMPCPVTVFRVLDGQRFQCEWHTKLYWTCKKTHQTQATWFYVLPDHAKIEAPLVGEYFLGDEEGKLLKQDPGVVSFPPDDHWTVYWPGETGWTRRKNLSEPRKIPEGYDGSVSDEGNANADGSSNDSGGGRGSCSDWCFM